MPPAMRRALRALVSGEWVKRETVCGGEWEVRGGEEEGGDRGERELTGVHMAALVAVRKGCHARADEGVQEQLGEDEDGGEEELPELDRLNGLNAVVSTNDTQVKCR